MAYNGLERAFELRSANPAAKFDQPTSSSRGLGAILAMLVLFSFFWSCSKPEISEGTRVVIVYTNDTHGRMQGCGCEHRVGGILKRSHRIRNLRAKDPTTLYCDAGNFLFGSTEPDTTQGQAIISVHNELGTSIVNISEGELEKGLGIFQARRREARFDFVSANIMVNGRPLAPSHAMKQVKGLNIAFVGLCAPVNIMRHDSTKLPDGIQVKAPIEAARQVIPQVSKRADLLVVLSTCGDAMDSSLAAAYPMIDAIIGGRSFRSNASKPWKVANAVIARAQREGRTLGRLEFEFAHDRTIKSVVAFEETMEADAPSEKALLEVVRKLLPDSAENPEESTPSKSSHTETHPSK